MSQAGEEGRGWSSGSGGAATHAYDRARQPELFEGVPARRAIAFLIDLVILSVPIVLAWLAIFVFGIVTLGLGFLVFGLFSPAMLIWVLGYYWLTVGSYRSGTIGMGMMDLEMRNWTGERAYGLLGVIHVLAFWVSTSLLTPLVLLFAFFNERRRQLHDLATGIVVINNPARAAAIRSARGP
jgi:uncharacterized RDD family membrane protein YckC